MKVCPACHSQEISEAHYCSKCGFHFADDDPVFNNQENKKRKKTGSSRKVKKHGHHPGHGTAKGRNYGPEDPHKMKAGKGVRKKKIKKRVRKKVREMPVDDRPRRPVWPFIAGFIAIAIALGTGIYFTITNNNFLRSQEKEIEELYGSIQQLRTHQKENYLEEALTDYQGDRFCDEAKEKNDAELRNEQKISYLKSIKEEFDAYDDQLASSQKETLDGQFNEIKGKYQEPYLINGEKEQFEAWEKDYETYVEERRFNDARKVIEDYGSREKMIANDDESNLNYSVEHLLDEDEFMPETLHLSVAADTYTDNGRQMGPDHFTLVEQIGKKGKETYVPVDSVSLVMKGNEARYTLKFQPGKRGNYTSKRAYVLHVRNQNGDRGFTVMDGTVPDLKIQQATADYIKDFVKAFNEDCDADSRKFNKMKDYLKKGSQAYDDYKDLPGKSNVEGEGIYDQEDYSMSVNKDHTKVTVDVTFLYEIGRYRSYDSIRDNSAERSFAHSDSTDSKDFVIYDSYVVYERDGEKRAQELDNSSTFLVHEYLSETNHFEIDMTNTFIGQITGHDNGSTDVTNVEGMSYQVDGDKHVYRESDLGYGLYTDGEGYVDEDAELYDDEFH